MIKCVKNKSVKQNKGVVYVVWGDKCKLTLPEAQFTLLEELMISIESVKKHLDLPICIIHDNTVNIPHNEFLKNIPKHNILFSILKKTSTFNVFGKITQKFQKYHE